jgi:hypothetical protein
MKPLVEQNEKEAEKALSVSVNSEVFLSGYDTSKNQQSPGTRSPTFVMGSEKEIDDFV